MKKRALSWLLALCMLVSLAPQTIPWAKAADSTNSSGKTDAFGLPTEIDDSLKTDDLSKNPYGTKGWIPLFQNHELVVAGVYDDEFQTTYEGAANGKGGQMSSFRWSNSTEMGNINRLVNVAFDPYGTGRDEYIATLAFDDRADRLRLYVTNKDRKVVNSINLCGDDAAFINELKFYQTRAMLCLTAGDFDGDGKDTLMVYVPGNNKSEGTVDSIHEFQLSGSRLTDKGQKINLGDVLDQGKAGLQAMLYHDGNGSNELRAHLSVDMEAGDVDLDGIEELAMTVNVNDLKKKEYGGREDYEKSYLTVYDGNNGWTQKMKQTLLSSDNGAKGRARFAGVTIGNFSNAPSDGVAPEVIAVGYYDGNDNYHGCSIDTGDLRLYSYQYQTNGTWTEKYKAQKLNANGFTGTGTKSGDDNQNPVAVAAVSADGAMTQEYLFISGSMYKVGNSGIERCGSSDMDKNRGIGGYIINNTGILDYAVGNFDGNKQGREQVYYVEYHKQETFDKEFLRIGQLYKEGVVSGETHTASENFKRWTDGWTYYGKKNCNVAITAADVNNDAVLAKIKEISYGYTDPKVMAILEASPHFSELDSFGNSATSFGQKVGEQTGVSASGSFGFDVMAGFEYVAPIIETGGGIEFNTSHTFTVGGGTTNTKEVEIKYANDNAEENSVVMYATPMTYYLYDVKYPDDSPQKESTMMLSVAMKPVTSIVSVDTYNEAAAAYADMDQIGANVQLGTPGQPNTYRSGQPKAGDEHSWKYNEWKPYYGTGTITESITQSKDESYNFNYEYEGSVQAYGIAGGFKAGGGVHWGVSTGIEKVSTEGLTKEGAVNCQNDPRYNFNWQFATWTVSLNGDDVPVLGYMVDNVAAPPSPAENLRLSEQTTNSMVLSWDSGARPAEYYKIYRYIENNKDDPFILVDTVDASEAASGSYEYTLTGLAANTEYKYAITSGYYTGNNESVESEIVAGKTLASDMERPTITGPNKDVRAPLGESATFRVSVSGPAVYKSFLYRWQKREVGGKWENISGATSNTYTVDKVTSELNGAMFRCVVTGLTSSSEPIPFYSDAAMLTVGMPTADAALKVREHKGGKGTKDEPFIGQSDYLSIGTGEAVKETKITSYTATATDGMKLAVYKVDDTTPTAYIGIGTDSSGNTVYYSVTANADATQFTAGAKLNESTVYTWKNGDTALTVPEGTSPDTALTKELVSAGEKTTYYQAVVLDDDNKPREYLYRDGKAYTMSGAEATGVDSSKLYLVHSKTEGSQYILSRDETTIAEDTQGKETEGAGDTTETKYYELKITTTQAAEEGGTATTTYTLSNALTYTAEHKIGAYTNPSFTLHQTETEETVIPETRKAGTGTALSLTTNTSNNNAPLSVDYTLTITNTSTGTVSTLTGKTDANGTDTKTWTAPIAGLYAITTTTAGGTASEPQYYLAGVQTVRKTEESETVYTLDSAISGVYGSPVALTTRQQTIKKTGDTISAEPSSVVDGVTYKYRLSSSAATETAFNGNSFDAPKAGTYVVSAYQTSTDNPSKQIKIASTTINVKRKPITLSVKLPSDEGSTQSYHAPANKSEITFTGTNELKSGDTLPNDAILINCDLYDSKGNKRDTSGRFEITLSLNNGEKAPAATKQTIADLLEKYEFTFVSRKVISEQQTGTVAYSVGEGGKVVARKGAGGSTFASNTAVPYGAEVTFDAYPAAGHMVKEWLVNGAAVSGNNYEISADRKRLTVKSFSKTDVAADGKLTVEVKFGSDSHKITFSAGEGGSLKAALADGSALTNEQKVPEGSNITFTAAPSGSKGVKSWTVDGKPYCWPDTTDLYRETTLTLKNISDDRTVQVAFTDGGAATHTITTGYTTENDETVTGVSISAKLASGADAALTAVPDGAAVTFTVNGLTSNHTVKEWLVDGQTAANSGGQTSFTLRDITGDHTVKAVIAVATAHTLTFKAVDADGNEITNESIAKLTATSNGTPLTSNSEVEAYKQIDFSVAVGENYYVALDESDFDKVIGWTNNVTVDPSDPNKATLTGWNADTLVTVTVKEKPVVAIQDAEGGTITVKVKRNGTEYELNTNTENRHADVTEQIYVTVTPHNGYYVSGLEVIGEGTDTPKIRDTYGSTKENYSSGPITKDTYLGTEQATFNVSATYAKKPVVTFAGDDHITVTAKQGDNELMSGDWVDKFSGNIVFTATPEKGWETKEWKSGSTKLNSTAPTSDTDDNTTYTQSGPITSNVNINVAAKAIDQSTLNLSVLELSSGTYGGTVSAKITRKSLEGYTDTTSISKATSGTASFYHGSNIVITATPADGYRVQDWTIGNKTTTEDATTKTLTGLSADETVKVRFVKNVTGLTFGPIDPNHEGGYISAATDNSGSIMNNATTGVNITAGIPIQFTAEIKPGYEIEGWYVNTERDSKAGNQPTYTYLNTEGKSSIYVGPRFQQKEYKITTGNHVTVGQATETVARGGEELTFTAEPLAGQKVTGWKINGQNVTGDGNQLQWTVQNGYTVTPHVTEYKVEAIYGAGDYTVTYGEHIQGSVASNSPVHGGDVLTFTATPMAHQSIAWNITGGTYTINGNTATVTVTGNVTVSVTYGTNQYTITKIDTTGGTVTMDPPSGTVAANRQVKFKATPDAAHEFVRWEISGSTAEDLTQSELTLTVTGNTTVKPVFVKKMITVDATVVGKAGTMTMTVDGQKITNGTVPYGSNVTFTVVPSDRDCVVNYWKVGTDEVKKMDNTSDAPFTYTINNVTTETQVEVQLIERPTYTITATPQGHGSVSANMTSVKRGGNVIVTAKPKQNYYLKHWLVNGVEQNTNGSDTLTLTEIRQPTNVVAVFDVARAYDVTLNITGAEGSTVAVTANDSEIRPGAISPVSVVGGSKLVFTASPAAGSNGSNTQMVAQWTVKVNGTKRPELSTIANVLTIPSLEGKTEVSVKFITYQGFNIPTTPTDQKYEIKNVTRTPDDTKPETEIRAGGTVEFVVKASDAGKSITEIALNDCGNVTTTPQADGSIKVTVKNVKADISLTKVTVVSSIPLRITPPSNGTITVKKGGTALKNGDKVMEADELTITATPKSNYALDTLTVTGAEKQENGAYKVKGGVDEVTVAATFKSTGGGNSGGGGGGGAVSTYTLTFDTNGGSAIDKITKDSGTTIDLTAYKPTRAGYTFAGWFSDKALTKAVTSVKLTANTTVYAKWTQNGGTAQNPFVDVKEGAYYYDAVLWAVEQKITSGTSATTFSPDASCTRAQMVTFLWRAAGSPKVENGKNPFTDVQADAYYYDAVLWAVEKGVTSGTSATTFSPDATVTRGQTVTFLYRNAGSPEVSGTMPFTDVEADAYYAKAVQWAVQQKITTGTSETTFSPMSDCTRGQIVTFLYRAK